MTFKTYSYLHFCEFLLLRPIVGGEAVQTVLCMIHIRWRVMKIVNCKRKKLLSEVRPFQSRYLFLFLILVKLAIDCSVISWLSDIQTVSGRAARHLLSVGGCVALSQLKGGNGNIHGYV